MLIVKINLKVSSKKVQIGNNQNQNPSPNTKVVKNKLTIRHLYHKTYRKSNE